MLAPVVIKSSLATPTNTIAFSRDGKEVGRIIIRLDGIDFAGVASDAAKVFLEALENSYLTWSKPFRERIVQLESDLAEERAME